MSAALCPVFACKVALPDPKLAGFNIQVLLLVAMTEHTDENRLNVEIHVALLPLSDQHSLAAQDWTWLSPGVQARVKPVT